MARVTRRPMHRGITLPWERRGTWTKEHFTGRRRRWLLGLLGGAMLVSLAWVSIQQRERVRVTRSTITEIKRSLSAFRKDMGRCPRSLDELVHPPRTGRRYLRRIPLDGWGRVIRVTCPGRYDPDDADVLSAGPSGSFLVDDNVH